MLVQSPVAGDARVQREAATLAGAGHEVTIIGRGVPAGHRLPAVQVLDTGRPAGLGSSAGPPARPLLTQLRAGARWLLLPTHRERVESAWRSAAAGLARDVAADVVHAHDRNTLALGACEARRRDVPLVYDAHELWSDRGLPGRPTPVADRRHTALETTWGQAARLVLTVSDGIAEILRSRGMTNVRVVRNTFPMLGEAPEPVASATGLLYAGRIAPNRDLEVLCAASSRLGGMTVTLIGPQDAHYASSLSTPGVERRPPLEADDLDRLYAAHGIAAVTLTSGPRNHQLALPNKLFHAVRAGVPVLAADLPEIRRVVTSHDIGELYRPGDVDSLVDAAARVRDRYGHLLQRVAAARPTLSWARDARTLLDAYSELQR